MMGLLSKLGAGIAYFCIATVLAAVAVVFIAFQQGLLSNAKLARFQTIMHDAEPVAGKAPPLPLNAEQPSYAEILEARAIQFRELELREEVVRQNVSLVQQQRTEVTAERQEFDRVKKSFDEELAAMQSTALVDGEENVRQTIEGIKPPQAKEQILRMLERGQMENVVSLLSGMPINKRAKIVAEFKTPEDAAKLAEILKLMGDGGPLAPIAEGAMKPSDPNSPIQR
jgi:hypothetical protein